MRPAYYNKMIPALMILLITIAASSCSGGGGSTAPPLDVPGMMPANDENRALQGIWDITYDLSSQTVIATPLRNADIHYNVTDRIFPPNCDDCIYINFNSFNPYLRVLDIDIALRNPSEKVAKDVRGIVFTDDLGHTLVNPYGWTPLFDIPGGRVINPFRAYARGAGKKRRFFPDTYEGENFKILIPEGTTVGSVKFAVDASWKFNCDEPYKIIFFETSTVLESDPTDKEYTIILRTEDYQNDIFAVTAYCPEVFGQDGVPIHVLHLIGKHRTNAR